MLTNWTNDEARKARDLFVAKLGGIIRNYWYESINAERSGTHSQGLVESSVKFGICVQYDDKSTRSMETTYKTSTNKYEHPIVVFALVRRCGRNGIETSQRFNGTDNPDYGAERHNPEALPTSVEEWVDKAVVMLNEIEPSYLSKVAAYEAREKAEQDRLASTLSLKELVEDGKLTEVTLEEYSYDCGDKRSYGELEVTAKTNLGTLTIESTIGSSGDLEDVTMKLNDKEVIDDLDDKFDPGTPHYYSGKRAVATWEEKAKTTLQEALEEYLGIKK